MDERKSLFFNRISRHFRSICNFDFFHKIHATFDRISRHFRSMRNFKFFSQNGCQRPFWMTKNHFLSHFSPFQINTQLLFLFTKWLPAAILDDRNSLLIAFLAISDQYATLIFFFTKWLPAAILDDRKSLLITFLTIPDKYTTFFLNFFFQNGRWWPFWKSDLGHFG